MDKKIYLIYDRQFGCVYGASSDRSKAEEVVEELNSRERTTRYTICVEKDLASK